MTKENYKATAKRIKGIYTGYNRGARIAKEHIAELWADYFAKDNPNFNRKKFLKACGLNDSLED